MKTYKPTPVIGYPDGTIESDEQPIMVRTPNSDGKPSPMYDNVNYYFVIDDVFYNVHPFRSEFGGYPVRMFSDFTPEGWSDLRPEPPAPAKPQTNAGVLNRDDEKALADLIDNVAVVDLAKAVARYLGPDRKAVDILTGASVALGKLSEEYGPEL